MEIKEFLQSAHEQGVSDIHMSVGTVPAIRKNGELYKCHDSQSTGENTPLTPDDTIKAARYIMTDEQYKKWQDKGEIDFAYAIPGVGRFRINIYKQRGCASLVIRPVPHKIPAIDALGLPKVVEKLAQREQGLVLITGSPGNGKSTTIAAMINMINQFKAFHIITIEDPIEYLYQHKKSIVDQREVGIDTCSVNDALKATLRQDPDVIMISELLEPETISIALTAAENGRLVIAALPTISTVQTIQRIIEVFPNEHREKVKLQLSTCLQGIITQQLIPHSDGDGLVLASEVLINNNAMRVLIKEGKFHQVNTFLQTGRRWGMCSMDISLLDLYQKGDINLENAVKYVSDYETFMSMVKKLN